MTKDELLRAVAEAILANERMATDGWRRIVVLAGIEDDGGTWIAGMAYDVDGADRAIVPGDPDPMPLLGQLRETMAQDDGKRPWLACVIRLDRRGEDVDMDCEFEYHDAERWAITPHNHEEMVDQFRPDNSES